MDSKDVITHSALITHAILIDVALFFHEKKKRVECETGKDSKIKTISQKPVGLKPKTAYSFAMELV